MVVKKSGSGWVLSDEGHTRMHLARDGDDPEDDRNRFEESGASILSKFGIEDRDGELAVDLPPGHWGDAYYAFVQALIEIQAAAATNG